MNTLGNMLSSARRRSDPEQRARASIPKELHGPARPSGADSTTRTYSSATNCLVRRADLHRQHIATTPHDALRYTHRRDAAGTSGSAIGIAEALLHERQIDRVVTFDYVGQRLVSSAWPSKRTDDRHSSPPVPTLEPVSAKRERAARIRSLIDGSRDLMARDGRGRTHGRTR